LIDSLGSSSSRRRNSPLPTSFFFAFNQIIFISFPLEAYQQKQSKKKDFIFSELNEKKNTSKYIIKTSDY